MVLATEMLLQPAAEGLLLIHSPGALQEAIPREQAVFVRKLTP